MRVLGIDPGTRACGWGLVDGGGRRLAHVAHGVVRLDGELHDRLAELFGALEEVIAEYRPELVAVEGVFTQKNARSALVLGHARGVALLAAARAALPVAEYPPATVKKTVVGTGRAEKHQVQKMVSALLRVPAPPAFDASDALAIAICHLHHGGGVAAIAAVPSVVRHRRGGSAG